MSKHLRPPSAMNGAVRAVIYARYSSENQREASIENQVRICKARIDAEGWNLVATYTDHAQSGASHLRSGYQKLLADGRAGLFDVVFAEALDRLSRDQEHVAALFKHLSFAGVKIFTLAEGEVGALHVGLKGTMNALYLTDLRQKVWRGLEGRVRQGPPLHRIRQLWKRALSEVVPISERRHRRAKTRRLDSNHNNIRVRGFVLSGAPLRYRTEHAETRRFCPKGGISTSLR
jgi:DNA invertase Pin-like site-specific DNA recombinase